MAANPFLSELSKRYNVGYTPDDEAKLTEYETGVAKYNAATSDPNFDWNAPQSGMSTPDQLASFKTSLEGQYKERGANSTGKDTPSQAAPSYGTQPPAQSWNDPAVGQAINAQTDLLRQQMGMLQERQRMADAQEQQRLTQRDQLYGQLQARASQNAAADPNTPVIQGQVNAFRAEQDRASRDYISDVAERSGPYENLRGEQRMAAERTGQAVGGFQAELMARELQTRRAEIADALSSMGGMLSADQQAGLQRELSLMDNQIRNTGMSGQNAALTSQSALGFGNLGLGYADMGLRRDLGFAGLDVQRQLGLGGLGVQMRGQDFSMDQFLRELALREWQAGDNSDFQWSSLGG